jgi:hypothetical protein
MTSRCLRPIVVTACMIGSSESWGLNSAQIHGTHVPVEKPSTASGAEVLKPASHHAVILIYPGSLAVTFHELESIVMPFSRPDRQEPDAPPPLETPAYKNRCRMFLNRDPRGLHLIAWFCDGLGALTAGGEFIAIPLCHDALDY